MLLIDVDRDLLLEADLDCVLLVNPECVEVLLWERLLLCLLLGVCGWFLQVRRPVFFCWTG